MFREPWFWIIVAVVVVLLFGAPKLPQFAKSLGDSINIFRTSQKKDDKAESADDKGDDSKPSA